MIVPCEKRLCRKAFQRGGSRFKPKTASGAMQAATFLMYKKEKAPMSYQHMHVIRLKLT